MCGFSSADDDSQYALQFQGRLHRSNENNFHKDRSDNDAVSCIQRLDKKQPKSGHSRSQNVAQNHGTQNYRAQSKGAQHNGSHKPHAQQGRTRDNGPQNDGPQKSRAQKAKEDFNA